MTVVFKIFGLTLLAFYLMLNIGLSHTIKEYDFEYLALQDETTPYLDVEYTEAPISTDASSEVWECGRSPNTIVKKSRQDGFNILNPETFIIGGETVERGDIPWMGAIAKYQYNSKTKWKVVCGAALLDQHFAVTAAHCLDGRYKDTLEVIFNLNNASEILTDKKIIRRKIKRIIIHPNYNRKTVDNDIALIEFKSVLSLSEVANLTVNVWPICLPREMGQDYSGKIATVSGWGYTAYDHGVKGKPSELLRKISVPILTHAECLATDLVQANNITENMICIGDGVKDSCLNDSGSPATIEDNAITYIVGITSWGVGCGTLPGVYTKVSSYIQWIHRTMTIR